MAEQSGRPPTGGRSSGGDINRAVRNRLLKLLSERGDETIDLTQGSADYLATRARDRIMARNGRSAVETGIKSADEGLRTVFERLAASSKVSDTSAVEAPGRLNLRRLRRLVEAESICGIFPWC